MIKHNLIAVSLLFAFAVSAQRNFSPATITLPTGDSLTGFVDDQDWVLNPNKVLFKTTREAEIQTFLPNDIRSVYVNGRKYEGKTFYYDALPIETKDLTTSAKAIMVKQDAFVEVFTEGPKMLYYYRDNTAKSHFFILEKVKGEWEPTATIDRQAVENYILKHAYYWIRFLWICPILG